MPPALRIHRHVSPSVRKDASYSNTRQDGFHNCCSVILIWISMVADSTGVRFLFPGIYKETLGYYVEAIVEIKLRENVSEVICSTVVLVICP